MNSIISIVSIVYLGCYEYEIISINEKEFSFNFFQIFQIKKCY